MMKTQPQKLLIVSNRLPVSVRKQNGKLTFHVSDGGLASALSSLDKSHKKLIVGWPGIPSDRLTPTERKQIAAELKKHDCIPVFLTKKQVDNYYLGYSNTTLWPLFHYFTQHTEYRANYWTTYQRVNKLFCDIAAAHTDKNTTVWIHDYQLMLLPNYLREKRPKSTIGFFLHIPFPSFEIFRLLPNRAAILRGLLGADLIGFHTYDYTRHFLSSVLRVLGHNNNLGTIHLKDRLIRTDSFPIGIDYQKFAKAPLRQKTKTELESIKKSSRGLKLILSLDRVDYSKGILERLKAYDLFLHNNPNYLGKVMMVVIAIPSRTNVDAYKDLRKEIERTVSHINGKYSKVGWSPISYQYRSIPFEHLAALYHQAAVALITPLRDGMNLVAKEYVATSQNGKGVLVLSEMAGAASELPEAILVNPNNREAVADAIKDALEMSSSEQKHNLQSMQSRIQNYDIKKWARDFIGQLSNTKASQHETLGRTLSATNSGQLVRDYKKSNNSLFLLDYDGTLADFVDSPHRFQPAPSKELLATLERLATRGDQVVIVSGRPKNVLEKWFGNIPVSLVAEHGGWIKEGTWKQQQSSAKDWKKHLIPLLDYYVDRTAGSFVEEKDFALVWHYRKVPPALAGVRKAELRHDIQQAINNTNLGLFEGNKIFEIKPRSIHKGTIARHWVEHGQWDFILTMGDDYTDESMFKALPDSAYSVKVGFDESLARFHVASPTDVVKLLKKLSNF